MSLYADRVIECLRQLRGEAVGRQAPDVKTGIIYGLGGPLYACDTIAVLSNGEDDD